MPEWGVRLAKANPETDANIILRILVLPIEIEECKKGDGGDDGDWGDSTEMLRSSRATIGRNQQ